MIRTGMTNTLKKFGGPCIVTMIIIQILILIADTNVPILFITKRNSIVEINILAMFTINGHAKKYHRKYV